MRMRISIIAAFCAVLLLAGCVGSESHWGDDDDKNSSANTITNNSTTANNASSNNSSNNSLTDAGTNVDMGADAGDVDMGTPGCTAYRQRNGDLSLTRATCTPLMTGGYECVCFDGTTVESSEATCDEALVTDCGAVQGQLVDEIGSCTVANRNAGAFTAACIATDDGWECACDLNSDPVLSEELDCFDAAWDVCYSTTPDTCSSGNDSCSMGDEPYDFDCTCETYGERQVDAPFCDDALEACTTGGALDGCTSATGYCDREGLEFLCTCLDDSTNTVPADQPCADVLAAECP